MAERYDSPYLHAHDDDGVVVADQYSNRKKESEIIEEVDFAITFGTEFRRFKKICMIPMMTISTYCPPVQLADLVAGITVCSLANSRYALNLFEDVALLFLKDPGIIRSTYSTATIGYGFKLFPKNLITRGIEILQSIDKKYMYTRNGLEQIPTT